MISYDFSLLHLQNAWQEFLKSSFVRDLLVVAEDAREALGE